MEDGHDERRRADEADGRHVIERIVRQPIEIRVDGVTRRYDDDGVAVGCRALHEFGAEAPARAGAVVDDDRLTQPLGELLADMPSHDVHTAAGSPRCTNANLLRWRFSP